MRFYCNYGVLVGILFRLSCASRFLPDQNYKFTISSASEIIRMQNEALTKDFDVRFFLYTSENEEPQAIIDGNLTSLKGSKFSHRKPTRIIISGWLGKTQNSVVDTLKKAYLTSGSFNVIHFDWSDAAVDYNYVAAAAKTSKAGSKLASFIGFLKNKGRLNVDTTYLIGHSLGAHIAGFAGKQIRPKKINTIFGLDPAMPLFNHSKIEERLDKADAKYVETIHTDAGILGTMIPLGHASFYPNYGRSQPGCIDITTLCDHNRAVTFFAETLQSPNKFYSVQCQSVQDIRDRFCNRVGTSAFMGGNPSNSKRNVAGIFYLPVNHKSPFGKGEF